MQIGDKARDKPTFGDKDPRMKETNYKSKVIYIHPERRFYRARYTFYPTRRSFVESHFLGSRRADG